MSDKLTDTVKFKAKADRLNGNFKLSGVYQFHRLLVEDSEQLKRRASEITPTITNLTCTFTDEETNFNGEVRQASLPNFPPPRSHRCTSPVAAKIGGWRFSC